MEKNHKLIFTSVCIRTIVLIFTGVLIQITGKAQAILKDSGNYVTTVASSKYNRSKHYKKLWGEHYRKEWATPVSFKKVNLDTLAGGLTIYEKGGGRQSKSLKLTDANKKEYVLRSIDKSFGAALPEIAQGTFIEKLANDQVTVSHPYAALTITPMAEAAGIYHTKPVIYYLPEQPALKNYGQDFGNRLYLFEQRPDENWEEAANFGNSNKIVSTDKMLEEILEDNDNTVDQRAFVKARLFDILIGDWGRHEEQWRWASFKDDKKTLYKPIPRDRDNAYTKFDGKLLNFVIRFAGAKHLQTFDYKIKHLDHLNFPARNLDHHLTNEVTREEWIAIANEIKSALTDAVIDDAIKKMPPEVYSLSGPEIAAKLKSRRDLLPKYAEEYFLFLTREVEITGSEAKEYFDVKRLSDEATEVSIYKINKEGSRESKPYFHRIFNNKETKEIRIYGIKGEDEFHVSGKVGRSIKLRLIGGTDKDRIVDESSVRKGGNRTKVYDNRNDDIKRSGETQVHRSSDSSINAYKYDYFVYNKQSTKPIAFYNSEDRIYVGLSYSHTRQIWRHFPYGAYSYLDVKYSIDQKAVSSTAKVNLTQLAGKWNLNLFANYDAIRWTNFYGLGNETVLTTTDRNYFRMRSRQLLLSAGLEQVINNRHRISIVPFYQSIDVVSDTERFLAKQPITDRNDIYEKKNFTGATVQYIYQHLNDSILPTKGMSFLTDAGYTVNLGNSNKNFAHASAALTLYVPLSRQFGLLLRGGGATLSGTPEFFQYNYIGGTQTLRGYQRNRFYGNSIFYNQNELRWITDVHSYLFNGKFGLFALYDEGRVWLKGENSNSMHTSYGGGILVSPFNTLTVSAAYAKSSEDMNIHLRVVKVL